MERAGQDAGERFCGGVFSGSRMCREPGYGTGTGTETGTNTLTAENASGVSPDISVQNPGQIYYKHPLLTQLEQRQKVGRIHAPAGQGQPSGSHPAGTGTVGTPPSGGYPPGSGSAGTGTVGTPPSGGYPPGSGSMGSVPSGSRPVGTGTVGNQPSGGYPPGSGAMGSMPSGGYPPGSGAMGSVPSGSYSAGNRNENGNGNRNRNKNKNNGFWDGRVWCPYGCGKCADRKQPNHTAYLLALFAAFGMLFAAFMLVIFLLVMFMVVSVVSKQSAALERAAAAFPEDEWSYAAPDKQEPDTPRPDGQAKIPEKNAGTHGEYYGEIKDAVRTDLAYSIEWENYEYAGNSDTVMISIDYPVIRGDVPNLGLLNDAIESEMDYFEEYYEEYSKYMQPEEIFAVYSEGFVTYMDESVMSVVFQENIYTDYWVDCGLFCVNIDMENGMVLDNGSILEVDDEFAVDFRTRSREQNGETEVLEYLTDQEVAYYLKDGSTGIIFYTPMGMEIGLNCGEEYLTVTYQDYEDYLLKY